MLECSDLSTCELLCQSVADSLSLEDCERVYLPVFLWDVVSECSNLSTCGVLCQSVATCLPVDCCVRV